MINKDSFYLQDIELCRALQPIMAKKDIFNDGYFIKQLIEGTYYDADKVYFKRDNEISNNDLIWEQKGSLELIPTWRKDSLEAALPEWVKDRTLTSSKLARIFNDKYPSDCVFLHHIGTERDLINYGRGQESLKALAQLIILLDKEGVE